MCKDKTIHVVCDGNKDLFDILLDENNVDPIVLGEENGPKLKFEQIAVIPHRRSIYAILKPMDTMGKYAEDEAFVFKVVLTRHGEFRLAIVDNYYIEKKVFDKYIKLFHKKHAGEEANE